MSPICPCCNSADTVSYWDIKANREGGSLRETIRSLYPNARQCVDCEHVWWRDPMRLPSFKDIGKDERCFEGFRYEAKKP